MQTSFSKVFDREESKRQQEEGMAAAVNARKRKELFAIAKNAAINIALSRTDRCVTADDVQKWIVAHGYLPEILGPAAGSLFRGQNWTFTEKWEPSARVSNHNRYVRVWRLNENV
jgi:hypothetical protein